MTVRREMPDMGCYEAILPYISGTGVLSQAPSIRIARKIESGKIYYVSSERTLTTPAELHTREHSMR